MVLSGRERADAFLRWTDELADGMEAQHELFDQEGVSKITGVSYRDRPWPGWGLGFTYGASLLRNSKTELMIVIRSRDPTWVWAVAEFVDRNREEIGQLGIDNTINWHEPITRHTQIDAFFIGPPVSLPPGEGVVHLDGDDHVHVLQVFPAYSTELAMIREIGGKAFASLSRGRPSEPAPGSSTDVILSPLQPHQAGAGTNRKV